MCGQRGAIVSADNPLPPLWRYVIVHVPDRPWKDVKDQEGIFYKVACRTPCAPFVNNLSATYDWQEFDGSRYFAHEVLEWFELPRRSAICKSN